MILGMVEILTEARVFAEKSGIDSENLDTFIQLMFPHSPEIIWISGLFLVMDDVNVQYHIWDSKKGGGVEVLRYN
jgi:hypothetical protein